MLNRAAVGMRCKSRWLFRVGRNAEALPYDGASGGTASQAHQRRRVGRDDLVNLITVASAAAVAADLK